MDVTLQAVSDKKIGETVLLPLAEKMVNTFSSKNSFRHEGGEWTPTHQRYAPG